ncbi:MAG: hypothetical protein FWD31_15730, partial [Planctomycetaceae bacterium]|nr:hypothetical protein [Planctomycetaceae bacterium]
FHDELGLDTFHLTNKGVFESECGEGEACPYFKRQLAAALYSRDAVKIIPRWGGEGMDTLAYSAIGNPTWCFDCQQLDGKFATFDIFDEYDGDREYFCRGIILDIDQVWPYKSYVAHVM